MLEQALIAHCAPTLAHLKVGSLFSVQSSDPDGLRGEIHALSPMLVDKGLALTVLRADSGRALLYLYRTGDLRRTLEAPEIQRFLAEYDYADFGVDTAIARLRDRLSQSSEFPHEIGVFLGYPLSDIRGFICNSGKNCLCCGCWKVYSNPCDAQRTFDRYHKCAEVYARLFAQGRSLARLTVRARTAC